jgi:hypothetical protein
VSDHQGGPLLVTGMPRTATSWVGKMLEASGALVYVNEPLNPQHPPGRSPGVLRADVEHAFRYISDDNEQVWLPAFLDTVRLRFHPWPSCAATTAPMIFFGRSSTRPGSASAACGGAGPCSTTRTRCSRPRGWLAGSAAGWWSRSATRWPPCRAGGGSAGRHLGRVGRRRDALVAVGRPGVQDGRPPLDSRANLQVWRERLTPEEVARIREATADVAVVFGYPSGG